MNDFHDYADGTRARRWIGIIFRPLLRFSVKALLWLCPDTPIVANVYIGYRGSAIHVKPNAKDGLIINVRIDGAPQYGIRFGHCSDQISAVVSDTRRSWNA